MKFQNPHDIKTIPGTEGWQRMYPYQYQFVTDDPERKEYEEKTFWFYDGLHYPEPIYPFDTIWDEAWYLALSQYNNRIFQVPPVRGVDHRIINGRVYISPVPVKDVEEIGRRVPNFMERAGYYYKNWDTLEAKWKLKMEATIKELEAVHIPQLPELEDISVVTEASGESEGYHLIKAYDDLINLGIKCWQYHFEFLNLGYAAYVFFLDFVQKQFPSIPLQRVTQMISGIDVIMFRPDDELKNLARKAIELEVDHVFAAAAEWTEVEAALKALPKGQAWLAALEQARYPWFNISSGTGWSHKDRSWNDDLNIPLSGITTYIEKLREGVNIERPIEKVRAERDRITAEYRDLIKTAEERKTFDDLLATARTVFPYVENHLFYVEHWFHSLFWNKMREVGALMQQHGMIARVEDIWLLRRDEITQAIAANGGNRIEQIRAEIARQQAMREERSRRARQYDALAAKLGLPGAADEGLFSANRRAIEDGEAFCVAQRDEFQNRLTEAGVTLRELGRQHGELAAELARPVPTVRVRATDAVGVARVELWADGRRVKDLLWLPDYGVYAAAWDGRTAAPGPHQLEVRAYDVVGNVGLAAFVVRLP